MSKAKDLSELGGVIVTDGSGNVGIGTSSPAKDLHIVGGDFSGLRIVHETNGTTFNLQSDSSGNTQLNATTATDITFLTTNFERMRILSSGGITFNGDTATANALDDYEEGTWTPIAQDNAGKVGTWDSTLTGVYTKIGRLVHVSFKITGTGMQLSATGYSRYSGLPFAVAERQSGAWASLAVTSSFGGTTLVDTDESIYLYNSNNAAASSNLIASSFTYYTT